LLHSSAKQYEQETEFVAVPGRRRDTLVRQGRVAVERETVQR